MWWQSEYGVKFMVRVWKDGVSAGNDTTHTAEQEVRKRGADGKGKEIKKKKKKR